MKRKHLILIGCAVAIVAAIIAFVPGSSSKQSSAQTPPDNEIWFTTHNGEAPVFFESNNLSYLLTYNKNKGIIKFDDSIDLDYIISNAFKDWNSLTSITFGNGVTRISDDAFNGCFCLESVTIPNSVTEIGSRVFKGCSSLNSLTIPNSVTKIGNSAFESCGIDSITIPNSVTEIGDHAFKGCIDLLSITIPDSVTRINDDLFNSCYNLESVTIPNSVTEIGDDVFYDCYALKSLTIPDSVTKIGSCAFEGCGINSITIPNSVTEIGVYAFKGCIDLLSITIPNSVTKIGGSAFEGCYGEAFINCNIPDGTYYAFDGSISHPFQNSKFSKVVIGDGVTKIGDYAFSGCKSLMSITIPDSVTEIGYNAFGGCTWLKSITIPNGVTKISAELFYNCDGLESITIGSGVTEIERYAFYGCKFLKNIIASNRYCYDYFKGEGKEVRLNSEHMSQDGRCVIVDGELMLCQLPGLLKYNIQEGVTKIGYHPFIDCSRITSITIPKSVEQIEDFAFSGCDNLTSLTCLATTPPIIGTSLGIPMETTIYVPKEAVEAYKSLWLPLTYGDRIMPIE